MLLALVDTDYRFLWADVGFSGPSSDAQIFNQSQVKIKIEDGTLGLHEPKCLGNGMSLP